MKEHDLALISAAVYAYLNSEGQIEEDKKESYKPNTLRTRQGRNKWKWSFAPAMDKKGHRICQWSR